VNIISYKRLHFRKFKYTKETKLNDAGVNVTQTVAIIEDEIIVPGDGIPKVVPDWVKDDDLFQLNCTDGSCSEITVVPQKIKPLNNNPRVKITGVKVAEDAKPAMTDSVSGKVIPEAVSVGTGAGKDWPKRESNASGLQG
jgi:hypothetical protein